MWLEAVLTRADLVDVAEEFSPLKIVLGETGSLVLVAPRDVTVIPDKGIALACDATIHWPVLGLDVPVSLRGLLVNILPSIENRRAGPALVFRLQIDHTGVAILPSFFDHTVTARINQELDKKQVELAWNFTETLRYAFRLPSAITSSEAIAVRALDGRVKVTEAALGLAVDFEASVRPRAARALNGVRSSNGAEADSPSGEADLASPTVAASFRNGIDARSLAMGALAGGLVVTTLRAVGGIRRKRPRW